MESINVLVKEHDLILEFLDQLAQADPKILSDKGPSREFFEEALDFARTFADKFHHWKEEYVMFGLLAQKHDGALDGEIERHRSQHEQCRDFLQVMSESLDGYARKSDSETRRLHRSLRDYVNTLRKHIRSENEIFFPMAQKALSGEEDRLLLQEFEKYEAKIGGDVQGEYRKKLEKIAGMC